MDETERQRLIKEAEGMRCKIANLREMGNEAPVSYLGPEAHEESQLVTKELWASAMGYLEGRDYRYVPGDQGQALLTIKKNHPNPIKGEDLRVEQHVVVKDSKDPSTEHITRRYYCFTPGLTIKETRRSSHRVLVDGLSESLRSGKKVASEYQDLPPHGLAIEKEEAGPDDLREVLETIRSHPPTD